jgi:hypothetical protein
MNEEISNHLHIANDELKRIADALEEILRLVKADQEKSHYDRWRNIKSE